MICSNFWPMLSSRESSHVGGAEAIVCVCVWVQKERASVCVCVSGWTKVGMRMTSEGGAQHMPRVS